MHPEAYERVLTKIERGLRLVNVCLLFVVAKKSWLGGVKCADEEWGPLAVRAIIVENVCVRREGRALFTSRTRVPHGERDKKCDHRCCQTHHYGRASYGLI